MNMEETREKLIAIAQKRGLPEEFAGQIADLLHTEKTMNMMISYLVQAKRVSMEDCADEAVAILEVRNQWVEKKKAEYYNSRYNELLAKGINDEED